MMLALTGIHPAIIETTTETKTMTETASTPQRRTGVERWGVPAALFWGYISCADLHDRRWRGVELPRTIFHPQRLHDRHGRDHHRVLWHHRDARFVARRVALHAARAAQGHARGRRDLDRLRGAVPRVRAAIEELCADRAHLWLAWRRLSDVRVRLPRLDPDSRAERPQG